MNWQGTLKPHRVEHRAAAQPAPVGRSRALGDAFPLWIKIFFTLFVACFIPVYWGYGEAGSFLWFYDVALLATAAALWFELPLLASMTALAVLLPEAAWNIGFFSRAFGRPDLFGLASYAFDAATPRALRALSLVHIGLPVLILWMVHRLGYDRRAFVAQTLFAWALLALSYALAFTPAGDFYWSLGVGKSLARSWLPGGLWLLLAMLAFPVLVYLPTHAILRAVFANRAGRQVRRQ